MLRFYKAGAPIHKFQSLHAYFEKFRIIARRNFNLLRELWYAGRTGDTVPVLIIVSLVRCKAGVQPMRPRDETITRKYDNLLYAQYGLLWVLLAKHLE